MSMRASFFSLLLALFVFSHGTLVSAQASASNTFTMNLSLGSRGTQVIALQQALNKDLDTRIANTGPGSPGYETDYFGLLTKAAVVRFQQKYASEVLAPVGLTQGSGYVGFYTRIKLNALSALTATVSATSPNTGATASTTSSVSTTVAQNPNLKNLDTFIAAIDNVATKQGIPATTLATIKGQIMKDVATTTDLRAAFFKQVGYASRQSAMTDNSFAGRALAIIEQSFDAVFMPEKARAATGVPFGGALLFSFYCTQSETWLITVEPLPPSFAALLTYVPFSQAFLSYNIPFTSWLLGEYEPGAGVCVAGICPYCTTIPSEGMISPMTGSSPL